MTACAIWLTAAHEAATLPSEVLHLLYWFGWLLIDLAYMVTSFQIAAISLVFSRDPREKPLVPSWVCWWGWVTVASFFTWLIWCPALSYYVIKGVGRIKAEEEAATTVGPPIVTS